MMASNPFSSRYLEPGAIPFCFRDKQTLDTLAQRFGQWQYSRQSNSLRLAIVGPHGSGKSTLMSHLSRRLDCPLVVLHSSTPKWNGLKLVMKSARKQRVFLVDGYEQLPVWGQVLLLAQSKLHRISLGVTAHRLPRAFELLWETRIDFKVETYVIERLLGEVSPQVKSALMGSEAWKVSRSKRGANLRESLFDMYDWWRDTVDGNSRSR